MNKVSDRDLYAKASARTQYDQAFEAHCVAEQIAVFHGCVEEAADSRAALQIVLQRGDEELNALPFYSDRP